MRFNNDHRGMSADECKDAKLSELFDLVVELQDTIVSLSGRLSDAVALLDKAGVSHTISSPNHEAMMGTLADLYALRVEVENQSESL